MTRRLRTALIGFGKMAHGYATDPVMARHYPYAAHAQVLRDHPAFEWYATVDPDLAAQRLASEVWGVPIVASSVSELAGAASEIEVAVVATPPNSRSGLLEGLPRLRAVLAEKPLGIDLSSATSFVVACQRRGVELQVNLWRRADERLRELADGRLVDLIGNLQVGVVFYGNGLLNNGTHMVDVVRMLFGEVAAIQRVGSRPTVGESPVDTDKSPTFALCMRDGFTVTFHPLKFRCYRENGLSLWGEHGRLDILNEGLVINRYTCIENRAMSGELEVAADAPEGLRSTVGVALYRMYDNLAEIVLKGAENWSSGASALDTARIVELVSRAPEDGRILAVECGD